MSERSERNGGGLRLAAALAIGLLAMGRTMTMAAGQRWFDVDPSIDPAPLSAVGPALGQGLDVLLLLAAAAGAVGIWRGGRWPGGRTRAWGWSWSWSWSWAILVPAAFVLLWHGRSSMDDQWIAASWIAAVAAGATAVGLARERGPRAVLVALLLAAMVPVAARGLMQVRVGPWVGPEHAQTLDEWGAQRRAFFADRGWTEDSPAARIFERRLRQPQPTGWFATTNVFATMAAASLVLGSGLAVAAWRGRVRRRTDAGTRDAEAAGGGAASPAAIIVPAIVAAVAGALLLMTGAKGAWAATLLGGGVLAVGAGLAVRRNSAPAAVRAAAPWLAVLIVPAMLGLTVLRGALPEDFAGDRSLLFRWQYLQGAAATVAESPGLGVGADGFQAAYLRHRPLRSPEEVSSVHAVTADWLVAAGVAAAGWLLALLGAAWCLGRGIVPPAVAADVAGADDEDDDADEDAAPAASDAAGLLADVGLAAGIGLVTVAALMVEFGRLGGLELMARLGGGVAAILVAVTVRRVMSDRATMVPRVVFAAAGLLAIAHAQIEMTATQPSAAAWWAVLVGTCAAAASVGTGRREERAPLTRVPVRAAAGAALATVLVLAVAILWGGMRPAARQSAVAADAAGLIADAAAVRQPVRAEVRLAAADRLQPAQAITPAPRWVAPAIARQYVVAIRSADDPAARAAAVEAAAAAFPAAGASDPGASPALRAALIELLAARADAGEPAALDRAIELARAARQNDPHGVGAAVQLARLLDQAGRADEAAEAARAALTIDDAKELDPAKQLGPRGRRELERIAAAGPGATSG